MCWLVLGGGLQAFGENKIEVASIGLKGYFKVGRPVTLTARVTCDEPGAYRVRVVAPDPQGNFVRFDSERIQLSAAKSQLVSVPFETGQLGGTINAQLIDESGAAASAKIRLAKDGGLLSPAVTLVGTIGQPAGLLQSFSGRQILVTYNGAEGGPSVKRDKEEARQLATRVFSESQKPDADFEKLMDQYSDAESHPVQFDSTEWSRHSAGFRKADIDNPAVIETPFGFHIIQHERDGLLDDAAIERVDNRLVLNVSAEQLSSDPRSLAAISVLVIARDYDLNQAQVDGLRDWIYYGGHLVVAVADEVQAYSESPLGKLVQNWIPVEPDLSRLIELPGIEGFADNTAPIPLARRRVNAVRIGKTTGKTLATGSDGPLIEQLAVGFGRVTLVGLNISTGPLGKWTGMPIMMNRLVFDEGRAAKDTDVTGSSIGHTGVTDLATQLHSSQASFPEVKRPSSWLVMGLILVYLLAIGPLDYLVVHRLLKRPRLTWITFPIMVALGCAAGIYLAQQSNGDELRLNQTAIVDIDAGESGAFRVRSWFSVYSPESRRATMTAAPTSDLCEAVKAKDVDTSLLLWNGIPENVFGGMLRLGGASLGNVSYDVGENETTGLPIPVWSTSSLRTDWRGRSDADVESRLSTTSVGLLRGSVVHRLPFGIKNWIVAHGLRVYQPRDSDENPEIRPGQAWSPQSPKVQRRDLESYLTGVQTIRIKRKLGEGGSDLQNRRAVYNALELDPEYAVRMLSLHEAAGGKSYTGLTNTILSELDLSRLIRLNQAVLIGEIDTPAGTFSMDGTEVTPTRLRTFVRILLPVAQPTKPQR